MKNRLFQPIFNQKEQPIFACLDGNDVITAKVSDHHPLIHNGILFWNVMMQGKQRKGGYNNGFGLEENDAQYHIRLNLIAKVMAEIVYRNPSIEIIGLCEGPNKPEMLKTLNNSLKKFYWMKRFFTHGFHAPNLDYYQNWGLLMLCDEKYKVGCNFALAPVLFDKLANRMHVWKLTLNEKEKYFVLGHFPFGGEGDECAMEKTKLSELGNSYCDLINDLIQRYNKEHFIFCADFNFNPYLLKDWNDRALDKIAHNNSILLSAGENVKAVTVDGVLLSPKEKQKYYSSCRNPNLFYQLKYEDCLFNRSLKETRAVVLRLDR